MRIIILLTLLETFQEFGVVSFCPKDCHCNDCVVTGLENSTAVKCNRTSLQTIQLPPQTCSLELSRSGISVLNKKSLKSFNGIVYLNLSFNLLTNVHKRTFAGIKSLKRLYLDNNMISTLEKASFSGLSVLEHLGVSHNNLKVLPNNGTFAGLQALITLDLSHNRLENLTNDMFRGAPSLRTLYLQHNEVTTIQNKAFVGLRSLQEVDLSYNKLVILSFDEFKNLRNLRLFCSYNQIACRCINRNLEGNNLVDWPSERNVVLGLNLTNSGKVDAQNGKLNLTSEIRGCIRVDRHPIRVEVKLLRNRTNCKRQNCSARVIVVTRNKLVTTRFRVCWDMISKLRILLFILGIAAILSNLVVIVTVWWVKTLRNSAAFLLVSHMAFCDVLVGLYALGIASAHSLKHDEFKSWSETYCPIFRSLFIFAEVVGVLSSLLVTCERYLAIVFCLNVVLRLSRTNIKSLLVLLWVIGSISAGLVQLLDTRNGQKNSQMCLIYRNPDKNSTLYMSEVLLLLSICIYLVVVMLYLHIFLYVRKSAQYLGISRESPLAKRIGAIVLSSFVFFAVPNFVLAWFIFQGGGVFENAILNKTLIWWLPVVCLVVNACFNPCFFAFRNDKFLRGLREVRERLIGWFMLRKRPTLRHLTDAYTVSSTVAICNCSQSKVADGIELKVFSIQEMD